MQLLLSKTNVSLQAINRGGQSPLHTLAAYPSDDSVCSFYGARVGLGTVSSFF